MSGKAKNIRCWNGNMKAVFTQAERDRWKVPVPAPVLFPEAPCKWGRLFYGEEIERRRRLLLIDD